MQPQSSGLRVALVIGNTEYRNTYGLPNAVRDAEAIAQALHRLHFHPIIQGFDISLDRMSYLLDEFENSIDGAETALFYFAGHGVQVDNKNYVLPADINLETVVHVRRHGIPIHDVCDQMVERTKTSILVVDACQEVFFGNRRRRRGAKGNTLGFAPIVAPEGSCVITSCEPGRIADDGVSGTHSPFAASLLRNLEVEGLSLLQVIENVQANVIKETRGRQRPWHQSNLNEIFRFTPSRDTAAETTRPASAMPVGNVFDSKRANVSVLVGPRGHEERRQLAPGDMFKDLAYAPEMIVVPAGDFIMGSSTEPGRFMGRSPHRHDDYMDKRICDEEPDHSVVIARPLAVGKYPVTINEWNSAVREGGFEGTERFARDPEHGQHPATLITWTEAKSYARWLEEKTGKPYRLLTEAEWEYSCRAGKQTAFSLGPLSDGDTITSHQANFAGRFKYRGSRTSGDRDGTTPVGIFRPNGFGLYDMHGNVWEWVEDFYHKGYRGAPTVGVAWLTSPFKRPGATRPDHVVRGGSFKSGSKHIRSASRGACPDAPSEPHTVGFRVARSL